MQEMLVFNVESVLDWGILLIVLISMLISIFRGFIREAISLLTWGVAIWVGITYSKSLSDLFSEFSTPAVRLFLGFFILFLVVVILGGLCNYLITRFVKLVGFGVVDRIVGCAFGLARGALIIGVAVFFMVSTPLVEQPWWEASALVPKFQVLSERVAGLLPEEFIKQIQV